MTKDTAVEFLMNEVSLYDKKAKVLYMPDVADEAPTLFYGIQEFHINMSDSDLLEEIKKHGGLTLACVSLIPAPGAMQRYDDKYGYCLHDGFGPKAADFGDDEMSDDQQIAYYEVARKGYEEFVNSRDMENTIVDPDDCWSMLGPHGYDTFDQLSDAAKKAVYEARDFLHADLRRS